MKNHRTRTLPLLALYLLALSALPLVVSTHAVQAADMRKAMQVQLDPNGPDEAWEISSKMEMPGMAMPAQTQKACLSKTDPKGAPDQDKNCKITDQKISGNKTTMKMQCSGKEPMTAELETTHSATAFSSIMKMKMKDGSMTMTSSGKLIGRCDKSQQDKKLKTAIDANVDESCKKMMQMYLFDGFNKQCAHKKTEFCSKLKTDLSAPDSYDATLSKVHDKAAFASGASRLCAVDVEKSRSANCNSGAAKKNWKFVAQHCPAETETLGTQHCGLKTVTRDYTAVRVLAEPEYAPICNKRAAGKKPVAAAAAPTEPKVAPARKESAAAATRTPPPAQAPAAAPAPDKKKEQGISPEEAAKALQKLFKF